MWTNPMELRWFLMWLLFGFIKGNESGICPALPTTEFADVSAEMYPPQTKLYYECDSGYDREGGMYAGIQCKSEAQGASWKYSGFKCIEKKTLLSTAPMMELQFTQKPERKTESPAPQQQEDLPKFDQKDEKTLLSMALTMELDFTQKPERKPRSSAPRKPEDLAEFNHKAFCGPPKAVPHASLSLPQQYYVGQVLHFKCQRGYDKRPPTSGIITCKEVNGKIIWTSLDVRCTNDSSQWPPQIIEPGLTHTSSSSSGTLPVTALCFVLLMIPAVFV